MPKHLSADAVAAYERDGFYFPIRAIPEVEALSVRADVEAAERHFAGQGERLRHRPHLVVTALDRLIRNETMLDAVEDLIGPNILCWTSLFFTKDAHDPAFVSWHQDSTYWGLEPADVVTAWVALSEAPVESGAMRFLPGSHRLDQIAHLDSYAADNLLTRGQEIQMEVDDALAVDAPLRAGEFSLHHIRLVHGSKPNTTPDRRIGLAVRYIPTYVRQVKLDDSATLVRGTDRYGHFEHEPRPAADLDAAACAAHGAAMQRMLGAVYSGTDVTEARR